MFDTNVTVYCINLRERKDRKARIQEQFDRLGLKVEWWEVDKHPKGGKYGCFESHWNIWKRNTSDVVMIFEDDIFFKGSPEEFVQMVNRALKLVHRYDIVHLGNHPVSRHRRVYKNFYEGNFLNLECYLGTKEKLWALADKVAPYFGIHIDVLTAMLAKQAGTFPSPFEHNLFDSDNEWCESAALDGIARKLNSSNKEWLLYVPDFTKGMVARWMMRDTDLARIVNLMGGKVPIKSPKIQRINSSCLTVSLRHN